jgi:hypothetical protein
MWVLKNIEYCHDYILPKIFYTKVEFQHANIFELLLALCYQVRVSIRKYGYVLLAWALG